MSVWQRMRGWLGGEPPPEPAAPESAPALDEKHLRVLLHQCDTLAAGIRKRASREGTSFHLTFLLVRLDQSLARMDAILDILALRRELAGRPDAPRLRAPTPRSAEAEATWKRLMAGRLRG